MTLYFLRTKNLPIFTQLQLEEALLRTSYINICLVNEGSSQAIVMGISGKLEELINAKKMKEKPIPIIKRFSGGGTVVVDEDTLFVSFLFQKEIHSFHPFPKAIMEWSASLYKEVFSNQKFQLRENDYVFGEKKFGGNAQYIKKDRWLHHTSFLWDYKEESMEYLLYPKKTPHYRQERSHDDFLCKLCKYEESKENVIKKLRTTLSQNYSLQEITLGEVLEMTKVDHRKNTVFVSLNDQELVSAR